MISDLEQPLPEPHPNILRYEKLRMLMGMNLKTTWRAVEDLGAIASYVGTDDFDRYLDEFTPEVISKMLGIGDGPE